MEIDEDLMDPYQFGSLKGSSTTFALIARITWESFEDTTARLPKGL